MVILKCLLFWGFFFWNFTSSADSYNISLKSSNVLKYLGYLPAQSIGFLRLRRCQSNALYCIVCISFVGEVLCLYVLKCSIFSQPCLLQINSCSCSLFHLVYFSSQYSQVHFSYPDSIIYYCMSCILIRGRLQFTELNCNLI